MLLYRLLIFYSINFIGNVKNSFIILTNVCRKEYTQQREERNMDGLLRDTCIYQRVAKVIIKAPITTLLFLTTIQQLLPLLL